MTNQSIGIDKGSLNSFSIPVGNGMPVLIDGQFTKGEWDDAIQVGLEDSVSLHLKKYKGHVFIGVKAPFERLAYIDLFLQTADSTMYNLHASSQLGQRVLIDTTWTDRTPARPWGYTNGWYANEVRMNRVKGQKLREANPDADPIKMLLERTYPYDGFEMQLRRAKFPGAMWWIRLEVRPIMQGYEEVVFPADSQRKTIDSWAAIELN